MRKELKKLLSKLLIITILAGIIPIQNSSTELQAANSIKNINLNCTFLEPTNGEWDVTGHKVYFGQYDGNPTLFRVLSTSDNRLFLDCDTLLKEMVFDSNKEVDKWNGSEIESWLNGNEYYGNSEIFTELERKVIINTTLLASESDYSTASSNDNIFKDYASDDYIFLLSAYEADEYYPEAKYKEGCHGDWWLRSTVPDCEGFGCAGCVFDGQYIVSDPVWTEYVGVSPALNLDQSSVIFASASGWSKFSDITSVGSDKADKTWKLTLADSSKSIGITSGRTVTKSEDTVTVPYTYSGNDIDQITVMITSGACDSDASEVLYYGALQNVPDSDGDGTPDTSGTGTFTLPDGLSSDCKIYILAEDINGDCYSDYASRPVEIDITGNDKETVSAPTADVESGTYTTNQSVTLSTTTDEADIYYTISTDGTELDEPTASSTKYTKAIEIAGDEGSTVTAKIKAIAVKDGMNDSDVSSFEYTINLSGTVEAPTIKKHPANTTVKVGNTATFTVTANGTAPFTYQWYVDKSDGNSFTKINGAESSSYTTDAVSSEYNGYKYHCVVTNGGGSATSNAAVLTVTESSIVETKEAKKVNLDCGSLEPSNGEWDVTGHKVYFGQYDGNPTLFRVLSASDNKLFLDCDTLLTARAFDSDWDVTKWNGSEIESWLNGNEYYGNSNIFTAKEKDAIVKTALSASEAYYSISSSNDTFKDDESDDYVFLLSAYETDKYYPTAAARRKKGYSGYWWTRSTYDEIIGNDGKPLGCAGCVFDDGTYIVVNPVNEDHVGVSPALNLNQKSVIFASASGFNKKTGISEVVSDTRNRKWKLTLADKDKSIGIQSGKSVTKSDSTVTVPYTYSGNDVNQITVMITSDVYDSDGSEVLYYGALQDLPDEDGDGSPDKNGTGTFELPADLPSDSRIYILAEDINGDCYSDYSSKPVEIRIGDTEQKEKVSEPTADVESGTYTENQSVTLSTETEGAEIYYTMTNDGTEPGEPTVSSTRYSKAIEVSGTEGKTVTVRIKAIAVKNGMDDSDISGFEYTIKLPEKAEAPTIIKHPVSMTVKSGKTATFTVTAEGTAPLAYQWFVDRNDGKGFTKIEGAEESGYTTDTLSSENNGYKYHCVVTNSKGSVTSNAASLTVTESSTVEPKEAKKVNLNCEVLEPSNGEWDVTGHKVYFGQYDGNPTLFRALNTSDNKLFLDCDTLLTARAFDSDWDVTKWNGSEIESWLNGNEYYGNSNIFTAKEKDAIVKTALPASEAYYSIASSNDTFKDDESEDHVFLLSAYETDKYYPTAPARRKKGYSGYWWTRSTYDEIIGNDGKPLGCAGCVFDDGTYIVVNPVNEDHVGVSPALNLNQSSVIFASASGFNKKTELSKVISDRDNRKWKLTLADGSKMLGIQNGKSVTKSDSIVTVPYTYSGNDIDQITVMITSGACDSDDSEVLYYGALQNVPDSDGDGTPDTSGTGTFTLPNDLSSDCKIYILAEDINGDCYSDYASTPVEIDIPGSDKETVSAPTADVESGTYTTNQSVTLSTTTDEADIYYTISTDGTEPENPTAASIKYTKAIEITGIEGTAVTVKIKAIAVKDGMNDSDVASFEYTITLDLGDVLLEDIPAGGIENIPDGIWIAGVEDDYRYTGYAIKPQFRIYDNKKRLVEKQDYSVVYKNNINVNNAKDINTAPSIIIKCKGNYAGQETATFKISPVDLGSVEVLTEDIVVANNGKVQKKVPTLIFNGKKLANKKDFTVSYPSAGQEAYKAAGTYDVLLTAKANGNFTGTRVVKLTVTDSTLISKASVKKLANQPYTGEQIMPKPKVTYKGKLLSEGTDYTLAYENNTEIGTATVILTGIGAYAGTKKVTFKITGTSLKGAKVTVADVVYDGNAQTPKPQVAVKGTVLEEGRHYKVEYQNNVQAGKATMTITGINAYSGTLKKTFKITAYDLGQDTDKALTGWGDTLTAKYTKGGTKPELQLQFKGTTLIAGEDYAVSYSNNKAITSAKTKKQPTVTIKGKGNFKGSLTKTFVITQKDLDDAEQPVRMMVADVAFKDKTGNYISKPVLTDTDGKALVAGKDYEKKITYELLDKTPLNEKSKVDIGTVITVTVTGKGAYKGTKTATYCITKSDFSKAKISISPQNYTGKPIVLGEKDITVKIGNNPPLTYGTDYEIVADSYTNNVKKGTASVTVIGKGNYGGMKQVKFKITAKKFSWFWRIFG